MTGGRAVRGPSGGRAVRGPLLVFRRLHTDLQNAVFVDLFDSEDVAVEWHDGSFFQQFAGFGHEEAGEGRVAFRDRDRGLETAIEIADGDAAVVRLLDEHGTIRVKLSANADGSGLVLLDDRTELGIQILAQQAGSSVRLVARDGGEQLLRP